MKKTRVRKPLWFVLLLIFILSSVFAFPLTHNAPFAAAHHNAPNEYNTDTGKLNEDMVHHGFDVGHMPDMPTIGEGNLNRAEDPWTP